METVVFPAQLTSTSSSVGTAVQILVRCRVPLTSHVPVRSNLTQM